MPTPDYSAPVFKAYFASLEAEREVVGIRKEKLVEEAEALRRRRLPPGSRGGAPVLPQLAYEGFPGGRNPERWQ